MPLGYTTYAANAIERTHRTLKDLMGDNYQKQGLGELIVQLCDILNARVRSRFYSSVIPEMTKAPEILRKAKRKKISCGEGDTGERSRILDLTTIAEYYLEHGPSKTYLLHKCLKHFTDTSVAKWVYIMPKFKLARAVECPDDMQRMLSLASATSVEEVRKACASPQGTYDLTLHIRLRTQYAAIFWCGNDVAKDQHPDFQKNWLIHWPQLVCTRAAQEGLFHQSAPSRQEAQGHQGATARQIFGGAQKDDPGPTGGSSDKARFAGCSLQARFCSQGWRGSGSFQETCCSRRTPPVHGRNCPGRTLYEATR